MPDLLADLNDQQREAVTHGEGPLLVISGAGSGKTRVITRRIAYLVGRGAKPEEILALTFSNEAAEEMRDRAEALIEGSYEELTVSTFHSFCTSLLRDEALEAGIDPFFDHVTDADRLSLLLRNMNRLSLGAHQLRGNAARLLEFFIKRIDRCKGELVGAEEYERWAAEMLAAAEDDGERAAAQKQLEFARVYAVHDELLREQGLLDFGDLIKESLALLTEHPHVLSELAKRYRWILVDEFQDTDFAQGELLRLLGTQHRNVTVVGDDDQAIYRFRGASRKNILDFEKTFPDAKIVHLGRNYRCGEPIVAAAQAVVAKNTERLDKKLEGTGPGSVRFWKCADERAQAQATAGEIEQLVAGGCDPGSIAVLARSVKNDATDLLVGALDDRGIPFKVKRASYFYRRSEVRDLLVWLRLLVDPNDSSAVTRALARAPIGLSPPDLARIAKLGRREGDMVSACAHSLGQNSMSPTARDQLVKFKAIHDRLLNSFDSLQPAPFVEMLIEELGLRKSQLFDPGPDGMVRLMNIAKFVDGAFRYERRNRLGSARDFAEYLKAVTEAGLQEDDADLTRAPAGVQIMTMHSAKGREFEHVFVLQLTHSQMPGSKSSDAGRIPDALLKERLPETDREAHVAERRRLLYVAMTRAARNLVLAWPESTESAKTPHKPSPFLEEAIEALGAELEEFDAEFMRRDENLSATFRMLQHELFETVANVGGRMSELRLDTPVDTNRAIAKFLDLLKVAALIERDPDQPVAEAVKHVNQLLTHAATAEQRELLEVSRLDEFLLDADRQQEDRRRAIESTLEHSLDSFLPRQGKKLTLSATDVSTYETCPLKYKFARVYRLTTEQTIQQRFGILIHQVLERYHASYSKNGDGAKQLRRLFESAWQRMGIGTGNEESEYRERGIKALERYHEHCQQEPGDPIWFERNFSFDLGSHRVRGRVDRVDRLPEGGYELIDYKTGKPQERRKLEKDLQLSIYQMAAAAAWDVDARKQTYYYVLDDERVELTPSAEQLDEVRERVGTAAQRVLNQDFEPTPNAFICRTCDFKLICPAAEK